MTDFSIVTDEEILKKLGQRIADLRLQNNLSQADLAYKCDFERPNVARIEAGNTNPTFITLLKLSKALDISMLELIDIEYK